MKKEENYFKVKVKGRDIRYRKWKVKDKKKFLENKTNKKLKREALVYDCLETNVPLSEDEYEYMLCVIRNKSLSDEIAYEMECSECNEEFKYVADLERVMKQDFQNTREIEHGKHIIKLGNIRNQDFYDEKMQEAESSEKFVVDFALHISQYNDQDFTFDQIIDIINEMELDDFEAIFRKWDECRFKINNVHDIECPNCKNVEAYEFDYLPNFYPESWNV